MAAPAKISRVEKKFVRVSKDDLEKVLADCREIKVLIPKLLNSEVLSALNRLEANNKELQQLHSENRYLRSELEHLKHQSTKEKELADRKYSNLVCDYDRGREEKFNLKCQLTDVNQKLADQSDFCSAMGATVCTLLWRISRQQETVSTLLEGSKAEDLLYVTRKTIISYFATCSEDDSDIKAEEFEFVLALCGIITNMAASPCGREFLINQENGRLLMDTFVTSLEKIPVRRNVKMRSLILMMLYNMSINFRGLQFLIAKPSLIPLLLRLVQEENDFELRLNSARLLQSIVMEPECLSHNNLQQLSLDKLQNLASSTRGEIQITLLEIIEDLQHHPSNLTQDYPHKH